MSNYSTRSFILHHPQIESSCRSPDPWLINDVVIEAVGFGLFNGSPFYDSKNYPDLQLPLERPIQHRREQRIQLALRLFLRSAQRRDLFL